MTPLIKLADTLFIGAVGELSERHLQDIEARTGVGPAAIPDRMRVTHWDPPRGFAITKLGPLLDGWAQIELHPEGAGTRLVWREEIVPRPARLGRRLSPLSDRINRLFFGRALDQMVRRVVEQAGTT